MCVLSINQIATLLLDAVNLEKDRHQLMDMVACNQESKECMIHNCIDCQSRSELEDYLNEQFLLEFGKGKIEFYQKICRFSKNKMNLYLALLISIEVLETL